MDVGPGEVPRSRPYLLEQVRNSITVDFPEGGMVGHVTAPLFWEMAGGVKEKREVKAANSPIPPPEMWGWPAYALICTSATPNPDQKTENTRSSLWGLLSP